MRYLEYFSGTVVHREQDKAGQLVVLKCGLSGETKSFIFPADYIVRPGDWFKASYPQQSVASALRRPVALYLQDRAGCRVYDRETS